MRRVNIWRIGSILVVLVFVLSVPLLAAQKQFEGVEIRVICQDQAYPHTFGKWVPEFEQETGMKVTIDFVPFAAMKEKQLIELASRSSMYDVIQLDHRDTAAFADAKLILALDGYIDKDPGMNMGDFMPAGVETYRWKGKLYGIVCNVITTNLTYRKDLYEKYGLSVPKTWSDLEVNSRKLNLDTDNDGKVDLYGFTTRGRQAVGNNDYIWNGFLRSYGGKYFDEEWKPVFNNEAGVEALETYVNLLQNYGPPGAQNYGPDESTTLYASGRAAHHIDGSVNDVLFEDPNSSQVVGLNGYTVVPSGVEGKTGGTFFCWGFGIPSFSKNSEAGFEFIKWVTSLEIQKRLLHTAGLYISRGAALDEEYMKEWPCAKVLMQDAVDPTAPSTPMLPEWNEVGEHVSVAISQALTGLKTPSQALDDAASAVVRLMEKVGYY